MKKVIFQLVVVLFALPVLADHHNDAEADVRAAMHAFNEAYATNDVEAYFSYYADDAEAYFYGERQDIGAYHEEWTAMVAAGGGVEKNELSDTSLRILPGGEAAVSSYFVDYRARAPDGTISTAKAYESEVWQKIDGEWKVVALHYTEIQDE